MTMCSMHCHLHFHPGPVLPTPGLGAFSSVMLIDPSTKMAIGLNGSGTQELCSLLPRAFFQKVSNDHASNAQPTPNTQSAGTLNLSGTLSET